MEKTFQSIGKILGPHYTINIISFFIGIVLISSGVTERFPPISPYGYQLKINPYMLYLPGLILILPVALQIISYTFLSMNSNTYDGILFIDESAIYQYLQFKANRIVQSAVEDAMLDSSNSSELGQGDNNHETLLLIQSISPYLIKFLNKEKDYRLRAEAIKALGVSKLSKRTDEIVKIAIKECTKKTQQIDLTIACIWCLGETQTTKAIEFIFTQLEKPDKLIGRVLDETNEALRKIDNAKYIDELIQQLKNPKISETTKGLFIIA